MAELNLKQITDKLNSEFASDVRKLVFWYDANAEFQEDIDSIELENAKVLHLEPDNQFYIKYFLEREDTTTNYLVYAPFAKSEHKGQSSCRYNPLFQRIFCRSVLLCLRLIQELMNGTSLLFSIILNSLRTKTEHRNSMIWKQRISIEVRLKLP